MTKGLALAISLIAPVAISAQEPSERVRLTLPSESFVAVVTEATATELVVAIGDGGFRTVARDEIRHLERSLGIRRQWRKGALYGALAGAGGGALWGAGAFGEVTCSEGGFWGLGGRSWDCTGEPKIIASAVVVVGVAGALYGALGGLLFKAETWERIEFGLRTESGRLRFGGQLQW